MAQQTTYTCDRCGAQKKDANHWFRVCRSPGDGISIHPWASSAVLTPDDLTRQRHVCGERCLGLEVQEFAGAKELVVEGREA